MPETRPPGGGLLRALRGDLVRRRLRENLGHTLRGVLRPHSGTALLDPAEIRRVLLCRVNGRLGNTLLLTPLIRYLHEALPAASIDLALAYPRADELLGGLPGVRQVIRFPHKDPGLAWKYLAAVHRMRATRYDLAIDPVANSTSGRMALALCRSRYRLGFDTHTQWLSLTHGIAVPEDLVHEGARPVYLLSQALGRPLDVTSARMGLALGDRELEAGRTALAAALRAASRAPDAKAVVGFFAHATGSKNLGRSWWQQFWRVFQELAPQVTAVELLPPNLDARTVERFPVMRFDSPREVAAAISATQMFICSDAGPMHLASSTQVPTIALFCSSDMARYRPMKPSDLALDVAQLSPAAAAESCHRTWQALHQPDRAA